MDPDMVAHIARETVNKAAGEAPKNTTQYATVVGVDYSAGTVPYVTVIPDGPGNEPVVATSWNGAFFYAGMRVGIMWTPPAGCIILGSPEVQTVPVGRIALQCGGADG